MREIRIGWVCPVCGRVLAPTMMECIYCNGEKNRNINKEDGCGAEKVQKCDCKKEKPVVKLKEEPSSIEKVVSPNKVEFKIPKEQKEVKNTAAPTTDNDKIKINVYNEKGEKLDKTEEEVMKLINMILGGK